MSAPVRSSEHRNGTYPTLKTFLRFFNYQSFEGVEAPEGNFLTEIEFFASGA